MSATTPRVGSACSMCASRTDADRNSIRSRHAKRVAGSVCSDGQLDGGRFGLEHAAGGEPDRDDRADAQAAVDQEGPVMQLDDLLDQRQAEPGATVIAAERAFDLDAGQDDPLQILLVDAD